MAKRKKQVVHIHYVHHIHHQAPASQAYVAPIMAMATAPAIMVHASMPGQPHTEIMTAPGFYNATPPAADNQGY